MKLNQAGLRDARKRLGKPQNADRAALASYLCNPFVMCQHDYKLKETRELYSAMKCDEEAEYTLPEFILDHGITHAIIAEDHKVDMPENFKSSKAWLVELTRDERKSLMRLDFYTGKPSRPHRQVSIREWNYEQFKMAHKSRVDICSVMSCLISDSSCLDENFGYWADSLGYDTDSRKAYAVYEQCQAQTKRFKEFLGADLFNIAINEVEGY